MFDVMDLNDILGDELIQRREEGYDVAALEEPVRQVLEHGSIEERLRLLGLVEHTSRREDWSYKEPSQLDEIKATLVQPVPLPRLELGEDELRDRLQAAWLGRCAGCNLGKPVEGWSRSAIRDYLLEANAYPLTDYFPVLNPMPPEFTLNECWPETTRGNIRFMARDDDIDYTILCLHVLETYGFDFKTEDVGQEWLMHFPFLDVYTAERAAYRNLIYGLRPPSTAIFHNPYREWIGAQIRADMWGYVSPGDPYRAIELAYKDAALSHTQNGMYGELWSAALIAAAFVAPNMRIALEAALACIPPGSRLAEAIRDVFTFYDRRLDWETARDNIDKRYYGQYFWIHTINNAALVVAALLWGDGDFTRTVGLAVQGGLDSDCNGATAGSVFGAMHGVSALPIRWIEPLHDHIRSAVTGYDNSRISELAERTLKFSLVRS
jgi:ADP-ribosylglycohydrolase